MGDMTKQGVPLMLFSAASKTLADHLQVVTPEHVCALGQALAELGPSLELRAVGAARAYAHDVVTRGDPHTHETLRCDTQLEFLGALKLYGHALGVALLAGGQQLAEFRAAALSGQQSAVLP